MWNQLFDGYCPESKLDGEKVKMRLNSYDFFESEKTGLQIAISYPGVHAVVLKFRGKGNFRKTVSYADEVENGELLSPQLVDRFPYCSDELFGNENEFRNYINYKVDIMQKPYHKTIKTSLTNEDFEKFWLLFFFNLNEGYTIGAIKRAYRDFNRTIEKLPKNEEERQILRKKWIGELEFNIKQLLDKDFLNQNEFDDWHHAFCLKLAEVNKDLILTVGQTQKWINMSLKYLFLMGEKNIQGVTKNYRFFHIPIDGIIQNVMQDKFGLKKFPGPWSKISEYNDYLNYQKEVRRIFANKIPMDVEFKLFNEAFTIFT